MVEKSSFQDQKLINILNDLNLHLKFIEQRILKIELELKSLKEKYEELKKSLNDEIEKLKKENLSFKNSLDSINLELEKIKLDLKKKADITDVKEIKNLFELFNPLKSSFVTREEVKRIVKELINIKTD